MLRAVARCLLSRGPACSQHTHCTPCGCPVHSGGSWAVPSPAREHTLLVEPEARAGPAWGRPSPQALMLGGEYKGPRPLAQEALSRPEPDAGQGQGVLGAGARRTGGREGALPGRAHPHAADPWPVPQCLAGECARLAPGPSWQGLTLAPRSVLVQVALLLQGLMSSQRPLRGGAGRSHFTSAGRETQRWGKAAFQVGPSQGWGPTSDQCQGLEGVQWVGGGVDLWIQSPAHPSPANRFVMFVKH